MFGTWADEQRYRIEMSIAISNGQTKAVIMRINEFTQVTHDESDRKKSESISEHTAHTYQRHILHTHAKDAVNKSEIAMKVNEEPNAAMSNIMLE